MYTTNKVLNFIKYNRVLTENILALFTIRGAEYLLALITLPYLVRVLGPDRFGLISYAQVFCQYFIIVVNYGFDLSGSRSISTSINNQEMGRTFSSIIFLKFVFIVSISLVYFLLIFNCHYFFVEKQLYAISFLYVIGMALFPVWFFQGIEQMRYITYINIVARLISLLMIFIYVKNPDGYLIAAYAQMGTPLIATLFSLCLLIAKFRYIFMIPRIADLKKAMVDGWYLFIGNAFISFYTSSNVLILGFLTNNTVVGYYSASDKIVKSILGLLSPISTALYPHINKLIVKSQSDAKRFLMKCAKALGTAFGIFSLILFAYTNQIVKIALGTQYSESIEILRILAFLPFIITLSNIMGILTMIPLGMEKQFSHILLSAGVINMILIFPLTVLYSGKGTAISSLFIETFVTLSMYYALRKKKFL